MALASLSGGASGPLLLLLHGMGANAAVWEPLSPYIAAAWPGRWLAPDFRGHGLSPAGEAYDLSAHVADIEALIAEEQDVTIVGHSMGGAVGIAVAAARPGVRVAAFGVKNAWDPDLLDRLRRMASGPGKVFPTEGEARERYLIASGLKGLLGVEAETAARGVKPVEGGFGLAMDPRAYGVAGVEVSEAASTLGARLTLIRGEHDALVAPDEWSGVEVVLQTLPGLGHNPHVEDPEALWRAISPHLDV